MVAKGGVSSIYTTSNIASKTWTLAGLNLPPTQDLPLPYTPGPTDTLLWGPPIHIHFTTAAEHRRAPR